MWLRLFAAHKSIYQFSKYINLGSQRWATLAWRQFWVEGNRDLMGSRKLFFPSLTPKKNKLGTFPRIRVVNKDQFYMSDPSAWQGKPLIIKHLLLLWHYELHSFTLKSRLLPFSPQFRMTSISHFFLLSLKLHVCVDFLYIHLLNLIFSC